MRSGAPSTRSQPSRVVTRTSSVFFERLEQREIVAVERLQHATALELQSLGVGYRHKGACALRRRTASYYLNP